MNIPSPCLVLLSLLGTVPEIPGSGDGDQLSTEIPPPDAGSRNQNLFCRKDGAGSGQHLQCVHHALRGKESEMTFPTSMTGMARIWTWSSYHPGDGADDPGRSPGCERCRRFPLILLWTPEPAGRHLRRHRRRDGGGLRTCYYMVVGKNPYPDLLYGTGTGRLEGSLPGYPAQPSCGGGQRPSIRKRIKALKRGEVSYDLRGGHGLSRRLPGGGGQPSMTAKSWPVSGAKILIEPFQHICGMVHDPPDVELQQLIQLVHPMWWEVQPARPRRW